MANLTENSSSITWNPDLLPKKEHVRLIIEVDDAPMSVERLRAVLDAIKMDEAKSKVDVNAHAVFTIEAYVEVPSELPRPSLMTDGGNIRVNSDTIRHNYTDYTAANDYSTRSHL